MRDEHLIITGAVLDKMNKLVHKSAIATNVPELASAALELLIKSEDKTIRMESQDGSMVTTYRIWRK